MLLSLRSLSLRASLLLLVALAVTPAFVLIIYSAFEQRAKASADALEEARSVTRRVVDEQERVFSEAREFLADLSRMPALVTFNSKDECSAQLAELKQLYPQHANIGVIQRNGDLYCSAIAPAKAINLADRAYFQRAVATKTFAVGVYQTGRITNKATVNAAYPILDGSEAVKGVLFVAIDLAWLNDLLLKSKLPRGVAMTVFDSEGVVLANFPGAPSAIGKQTQDPAVRKAVAAERSEDDARAADPWQPGQDYAIYPLYVSPGKKAYVKMGIDKSIVYADIDHRFYRNLLLIGVATLFVLLLAWKGGEFLVVKRVRLLADTARRLGAGDLEARTRMSQGPHELRQLAHTFDEMADGLQTRQIQIERSSIELQHVNRALKTLSASNRTLLRTEDEQELLQNMCNVAVNVGGYTAACVGYAEHDATKTVRVMSHAGLSTDFFAGLKETWCENERGSGLVGTAIRSGAACVSNDLTADPQLLSWHDALREHKLASGIALPLVLKHAVIGAIAIYDTERAAFDEQEMALLRELAADLAFGIATLRLRIEHARANSALKHMALHDTVTNLPNRPHLYQCLTDAIAGAHEAPHSFALLYLALARFEEIKEALGYQNGDMLLKRAAALLVEHVERAGIVAHIGENEFSIMLPGADLDYAIRIAEKLLDALEQPLHVSGIEVEMRAHIGISLYPSQGDTPDKLIRRAAAAVRDAAQSGQRYATRSADPEQESMRRLALISELRRAIDGDQMVLYYQPKIDARTGLVSGAEALVRWQHPQRGLIAPAQFIPIAEQTGLIKALTDRIIYLAVRQRLEWREAGFELPIAINFSAHNLCDSDLIGRLETMTNAWSTQTESLQVEITESMLLENPVKALETLRGLSRMGMQVYIDDFGTGYSSLGYLATLPVNALKIDRSFVNNMVKNSDHMTIVSTIISMAHTLNLKVVAEGVETTEQADLLKLLNCDELQGYLYSTPLPAREFRQWAEGYEQRAAAA